MLFRAVLLHYGIPEDILSDRGPQFISHVWAQFFKKFGAMVSLTSGYHPESNGEAERAVQEISRFHWAYYHGQQQCSLGGQSTHKTHYVTLRPA